jgi:hypothetical protein
MQVPPAWNNHFSYRTFCDLTSRNGGVDLISDALPLGWLWYDTTENAIGYAMHSSRSHDAVSTTAKYVNFVIDSRLRSFYDPSYIDVCGLVALPVASLDRQ